MRILVAGATGALGRPLVSRLTAAGHQVFGMTRHESGRPLLSRMGATAIVADALDRAQVAQAVAAAGPEVVVHQLTALSGPLDMRHFDRAFAPTNRLRTEATDHLLAAARSAGARRFVVQSYAGWPFARTGGAVKTEDDPLDPTPAAAMRLTLAAIRHLETTVAGADWIEGVVLRYGAFYGPGTSLSASGAQAALIRQRKYPLVGTAAGVWSFVHIEDAADATVAAIDRGGRGIYNIVDDEPAAVAEWLPALAAALGAKPPRRVPRWLGRLVAGEAAVILMTEARGASNAKAKRELAWQPRHPSWRRGFAEFGAIIAEPTGSPGAPEVSGWLGARL